LPCALSSLAE
jgi:hypothetical protein